MLLKTVMSINDNKNKNISIFHEFDRHGRCSFLPTQLLICHLLHKAMKNKCTNAEEHSSAQKNISREGS